MTLGSSWTEKERNRRTQPKKDNLEQSNTSIEMDSDVDGSDSDGGARATFVPGQQYTQADSRGRGRSRDPDAKEKRASSRSRSRSTSVSRAFRRLLGGKSKEKSTLTIETNAEERPVTSSQRGRRRVQVADEFSADPLLTTPKDGNDNNAEVIESLTGLEISIEDDGSTGPFNSLSKKKKKTKRRKEKGAKSDDEDTIGLILTPTREKSKRSGRTKLSRTLSDPDSGSADFSSPSAIKKKIKKKREKARKDGKPSSRSKSLDGMGDGSFSNLSFENEKTFRSKRSTRSLKGGDFGDVDAPSSSRSLRKRAGTQPDEMTKVQKSLQEALEKISKLEEELRRKANDDTDFLIFDSEDAARLVDGFASSSDMRISDEIAKAESHPSVPEHTLRVLRRLEEENATLRSKLDNDHELSANDDENLNLRDMLAEERKAYNDKLIEKEERVYDLETKLEQLQAELDKSHALNDGDRSQLEEALDLLDDKEAMITGLKNELLRMKDEYHSRLALELSSKDGRIQELEDELIATRAVIEAKTSDQLSMEMKAEIRSLKANIEALNKQMKNDQKAYRSNMKEKDEALGNAQRELSRLQLQLKTSNNRASEIGSKRLDGMDNDALKELVDELEDEIHFLKQVNAELEDEVVHFKEEANELRDQLEDDQELDDNASIGSFTSQFSKQSKQSVSQRPHPLMSPEPLNASHRSIASLSREDLFFVPDLVGPDNGSREAEMNSSQRAMRSVTDLWSKMTMKQSSVPANTAPSAGLYQMRLDD